jgi:hypothetical protein
MKQAFEPVPKPRQCKADYKRMHVKQHIPAAIRIKQGIIVHHKKFGNIFDGEEEPAIAYYK